MSDEVLKKLAKELMECYDKAYNIYKIDVDNIINNKITDIHYIEQTLDNCLDIYIDKGFNLFMKLLMYYSEVDLEKSFAYVDIVKEDRKEEYDEYVKKMVKDYQKKN